MAAQTIVIKIGGSTLGQNDTSLADMVALHGSGIRVVVVHGGGAEINRWLSRLNLESRFVDGLRVTGEEELRVVTAVLAGLVNKALVLQLNAHGGRAVGLSGVDGSLARATITNPMLGRVGDISHVEPTAVTALLAAGFTPVISPVCWGAGDDGLVLLNVNADDVAAEIAAAIGASSLIYLTDVPGILDHSGRVMPQILAHEVDALVAAGVIRGGMIPKARACTRASRQVARTRIIDGTAAHALLRELEADPGGTTIVAEKLA